jgi:hypothetical protein
MAGFLVERFCPRGVYKIAAVAGRSARLIVLFFLRGSDVNESEPLRARSAQQRGQVRGGVELPVHLASDHRHLTLEVTDDGRGFDRTATGYGTGLQGMVDRLDSIGGAREVRSAPGEGR